MKKVSICECKTYDSQEVREAILKTAEEAGGLDWVKPGMKIAIKVNLIAAKSPESGAVTHYSMVTELARILVERGAKVIVGDSPGGPFNTAALKVVYSAAKLDRVTEAGAELNYDTESVTANFPGAVVLKQITYTKYLAEADAIITFAKLKTHAMLGMTAATKNQYGVIPGIMKAELHYAHPVVDEFCNMIVDINEFIKPRMSFIDAVIGMEGNGPSAGDPRFVGALIASESQYCADVVAAHIINYKMEDLPMWQTEFKRGLAPARFEDVEVIGDAEKFVVRDYVHIDQRGVIPGGRKNLLYDLARKYVARRPKVDSKACVGCGLCAKNCPAKAITIKKIPHFDTELCIRCFCCQELCPKQAITVHVPWITRITS